MLVLKKQKQKNTKLYLGWQESSLVLQRDYMEYTVTRQEMRMFDCMMIYHIFQIVWFLCRLELHYTVKENFIKNI